MPSQPSILRPLLMKFGLLLGLAWGGALVIHLLKGTTWLESLYLAFITLSTLGSRDVADGPNSEALMGFMIIYIILGLSTFAYLAADIAGSS